MKKRVIKRVFFATIVALGLPSLSLAASPAQIENGAIKVGYGDLNITTEAGAKKLYVRLQRASEQACEVRSFREFGSIDLYNKSQVCYSETLAAVVKRVDSDMLTRIHTSS